MKKATEERTFARDEICPIFSVEPDEIEQFTPATNCHIESPFLWLGSLSDELKKILASAKQKTSGKEITLRDLTEAILKEHQHAWERDYTLPTRDMNPPIYVVICKCGMMADESERYGTYNIRLDWRLAERKR